MFQNTRTRQKERIILCWRLLRLIFGIDGLITKCSTSSPDQIIRKLDRKVSEELNLRIVVVHHSYGYFPWQSTATVKCRSLEIGLKLILLFSVFDFGDSSPEVYGNINAPKAVVLSALIYSLRCLVGQDIPLNQVTSGANPIKFITPVK